MKDKLLIIVYTIILLTITIILNSCGPYMEPMKTEPATLGVVTRTNKDLTSLPIPKEKIIAAVYKFRDQTGQYKPSETGANWSTAVTQGATSILLRALEESGWFIPIEREGLSNLLNERKIIRSSTSGTDQPNSNQETNLPPLLFAGILLEGGIISYDSNILTGGVGLKYFGAGGSGQYRQDRITIYLRAISTSNGRILKTVYTSKTILTQLVDVGLFRFVEFKRLLEVETGYSYNEPPEICVTEAIEKAVQSLIVEGVEDGLWSLAYPEDINHPTIIAYQEERENNKQYDYFGFESIKTRTLGLGINTGGQQYQGDYGNFKLRPLFEIFVTNPITTNFDIGFRIGTGSLASKKDFESDIIYAGVNGKFYLLEANRISPYVTTGVDAVNMKSKDRKGNELKLDSNWAANLTIGLGLEYRFFESWGLNLLFDYNYLLTDEIDGITLGDINDYFWAGRIGFSFYPGL